MVAANPRDRRTEVMAIVEYPCRNDRDVQPDRSAKNQLAERWAQNDFEHRSPTPAFLSGGLEKTPHARTILTRAHAILGVCLLRFAGLRRTNDQ